LRLCGEKTFMPLRGKNIQSPRRQDAKFNAISLRPCASAVKKPLCLWGEKISNRQDAMNITFSLRLPLRLSVLAVKKNFSLRPCG
jgi:hypothetical protein